MKRWILMIAIGLSLPLLAAASGACPCSPDCPPDCPCC